MYGALGSVSDKHRVLRLASSRVSGFHVNSCLLNMSSPPNGRTLTFPALWRTATECSIAGPQPAEVRSPSDEQLMAWLEAKDANGVDLLYSRYSRLVFGIALRILNDKSEAEEVVQETFLYLYERARLFD